ncbi:MAG: RidA family protein [Erysipelotrichaceae bacterium]|nr:RidA family protein [Erysipelotrichaceae bacterium]
MFTKGIFSDNAPKAIGPYSPAVQLGDFVYVSGQIPVDPKTNQLAGDDIVTQTKQSLDNMCAVLAEMGLETRHVVKTTVFMTDLEMFNQMNEVYATYFKEPYPARSCVQVVKLPKGSLVEIECLAIDTLRYEMQYAQSSCNGCCGSDDDCGCDGTCCG